MDSNAEDWPEAARARISSISTKENPSGWPWAVRPWMKSSRSGSGNGALRNSRTSTSVYIDVFTPMPSASVTSATIVKPGVLINWRKAKRSSESMGGKGMGE